MMDKCETCVWYVYDEDYDDYICDMDLDEDELARFLAADTRACPLLGPGDDYITARKQKAPPTTGVPACSAERNTTHCVVFPVFCGAASGLTLAAARSSAAVPV